MRTKRSTVALDHLCPTGHLSWLCERSEARLSFRLLGKGVYFALQKINRIKNYCRIKSRNILINYTIMIINAVIVVLLRN